MSNLDDKRTGKPVAGCIPKVKKWKKRKKERKKKVIPKKKRKREVKRKGGKERKERNNHRQVRMYCKGRKRKKKLRDFFS